MRITLSWHNSEVSEVAWLARSAGLVDAVGSGAGRYLVGRSASGGDLRVVLAVASVQRTGQALAGAQGDGDGGEWGFIKGPVLTLAGARLLEDAALASPLGDCIGSVAQGQWCEDTPGAQRGMSEVPLPWLAQASGTLSLAFRNGSELKIHAERASIVLPPGAVFIESYAC
jgi:hypothetical protein